MKQLINKDKRYIKTIGKFLCIEKYSDGSEFYCLLDKYDNFNIVDTGNTFNEIEKRIKVWEDLISRKVVRIV